MTIRSKTVGELKAELEQYPDDWVWGGIERGPGDTGILLGPDNLRGNAAYIEDVVEEP